MMLCGTPNLKMMDLMKLTAMRDVELVIGTASIHLVNLSTATSRCVLPPLDDFLSGPTMSSPQVANGQDSGMVLSSHVGACGLLANFWQATQRRMISSAFFIAVGQWHAARNALDTSTRLLAWCPQVPSWISSSRALPSSSAMPFWSIWEMLHLYNCLLITVNALDCRLTRRASATSCGRVPSIRNRRNGFAQSGPSSAAGSASSTAWLLVSSAGFAVATCAGSRVSSSSATASGATDFVLIDLWLML